MKVSRTVLTVLSAAAVLLGTAPLAPTAKAEPTNLGLKRPAAASGVEAGFSPERAFDGDAGPADPTPPAVHNDPNASRWSANSVDTPWISVDLGAPADLERVKVRWGNTFATSYTLQGSVDGTTWTDIATGLKGAKGTWVETAVTAKNVSQVRLQVGGRSQTWPISIWEIEVLGTMENPPVEPLRTSVVPLPVTASAGEGAPFRLDASTVIDAGDSPAGARLAETLRASTGLPLPAATDGDSAITLTIDPNAEVPGVESEGYLLTSTAAGVTITARTETGLSHGTQTLLQLLGPWSRSAQPVLDDWTVPALNITDGPRYEWRGFMLDSARSFVPTDEVKQIIDQLAAYKLNVLHMHLSDDQGWRIAISNEGRVEGDTIDYSLLTSVSGNTAVATTNFTNKPGRTGFYTAEDFAAIVDYAAERNISVIPEIDGPAHAQAILHAVPEANGPLSVPKPAAGQNTAPANTTTSVGESTLDTRLEATYTLLNHVFTQLLESTPASLNGERYFHIGGDESFSTKAEDYRYFFGRASQMLTTKGATVMAWNEGAANAPNELPDGSVIHYWVGSTEPTRNWVNANNGRALMSPAGNAYLPQSPGPGAAGATWACGGPCTVDRFYNWNPTTMLGAAEEKVLGVEAPLWAEHTRSLASIEYLMYPRLMATAEVGWTPQARRSIADFKSRLSDVLTDLTVTGSNFYSNDGAARDDLIALQVPASTPDGVDEIALLSSPQATLGAVTAELDVDGTKVAVDVTVDRPYLPGDPKSFDDRQAAGLFRFTVAGALPEGSLEGRLDVTVAGRDLSVDVPLTIDGSAPVVTTPADLKLTIGQSVDLQIEATDAGALTFSAQGLPAGVSIDEETGRITGTPTAAGTSKVLVTVTDALGNKATVEFQITVEAKPSPTPTPTKSPTPTPTKSPTPSPSPTTSPKPGFEPSAPYTVPGVHRINGRVWNTTCGDYSQTTRCRTDIWASVVVVEDGRYVVRQGWTFNNLTYLPYMTRAQWKGNPLGHTNRWTAKDGRQWMTECDTAATGRGGCRSFTLSTVVSAKPDGKGGYRFVQSEQWVFNNIVMFRQ